MNKFSLLALLLTLAGCASGGVPDYTPDTGSYQAWRDCRVAYEDTHKPSALGEVTVTSVLFGAMAADMAGNARLEGPEMDKAVNKCMAGKGFHK